jgi:predicted AAA+ superfamily ATPase
LRFLERVLNGKVPSIGEITIGADLIERDVRDISHIEYIRQMPKLLRVLAAHSARLVNYSSVGAPLRIGRVTAQRYTDVLAHLYPVFAAPISTLWK